MRQKNYHCLFLSLCMLLPAQALFPEDNQSANHAIIQKILFQDSYINYAWGYVNYGWFIDNSGVVKRYVAAGPSDWKQTSSSGYISEADLIHNYSLATDSVHTIDPEVLAEKFQLIASAAQGKLSNLVQAGMDMGALEFLCYLWDEGNKQYKAVRLSLWGDFSQRNLDSCAIVLDYWLKGIDDLATGITPDKFPIHAKPVFALKSLNNSTLISYSIPTSSFVYLKIINASGKELKTLVNRFQKPDSYTFNFNTGAFSGGVYFIMLSIDNCVSIQKVALVK